MNNGGAVIEAMGLTRRFGDLIAVDGVNLSVRPGEIHGLVGPDGAGKTTTLRMLAGILGITGGSARVAGFDLPGGETAVRDHLAYMSQRFGLYPDLTVQENVDFYADLYGVTRKGRKERMEELLDFSSMRPFRKRLAGKLSGGMKQKLQLVCALIHTPQILLLDEPTNGVDPVSRRDFWRILHRLLVQDVAILVTTAYLDEAERCTRVGLINQGRIIAEGVPGDIRKSFAHHIVAVRTPQAWKAGRILRAGMHGVKSVDLFGDSLHVVCDDPGTAIKQAASVLEEHGLDPEEIREVSPNLEDVFISTLASPEDGADQEAVFKAVEAAGDSGRAPDPIPSVEVRDLAKHFGDFVAVDKVNFSVPKGQIFGFLGPNGAGKSTTIRMLCGLLEPTSGAGSVAGFDVFTQAERIKENIGYMSQKFSLYEDLTVEENIRFYGGIYGLSGRRLHQRKEWAVHMAGLGGREKSLTRILSGGWKQRLALACAILHEPPIVFLDEPTSGVDPMSRRRFWNLIYGMAGHGITVFVTTHYMEEAEYCDRIALIYRGRVIALDTPHRLKTRLMDVAVLDVRCPRPQDAAEVLSGLKTVRDVALFGAGLHVTVDDETLARPGIEAALAGSVGGECTLERILPSMEDVFVSMIESEDRKDDGNNHSETRGAS